MTNSYPPRIQAFRKFMIDELPRAPNDGTSRKLLEAMPTRQVILSFVTWRLRLIPAKPRRIAIWRHKQTILQFQAMQPKLLPLLQKVKAGKDLGPHLSNAAKTKGIILPGAKPSDRREDIDMVLTREGLHHFHVGVAAPSNPKGRSDTLVFAEVLDKSLGLSPYQITAPLKRARPNNSDSSGFVGHIWQRTFHPVRLSWQTPS
jgi:hypothetical protein